MKWLKSPDALVQAFDHCLPIVPGVQRKAMFGYPCAFVNGHLFCGLHQDGIIVRLSEGRRNALVSKGARVFEAMPGDAMKEYVVAPAEIVADRKRLSALLREALAHASTLAAKPKKPRAAKKKALTTKRKGSPVRRKAPAKKKALPRKVTPARKVPAKRKAARKAGPKKRRTR
jgi:hypothetical protein